MNPKTLIYEEIKEEVVCLIDIIESKVALYDVTRAELIKYAYKLLRGEL